MSSTDRTIEFWDLTTERLTDSFTPEITPICSAAVSGDGQRAIWAATDGTVKLWDIRMRRLLRFLNAQSRLVDLSANGRVALLAGSGVSVWRCDTTEPEPLPGTLDRPPRCIALDRDGCVAMSGWRDGQIALWDLSSSRLLHCIDAHRGRITSVALSPGGRLAVSGAADGTIKVWSVGSGQLLASATAESWVTSLATSADGSRILAGDWSGRTYLFEMRRDSLPGP